MLTWWTDRIRVTSESRRLRSSASTCNWTRNTLAADGAHSTSISRSGWLSSDSALVQSARWTETPLPRVTKPMMGSPGTGVQQRANLTHTSAVPTTTPPGSPLRRRIARRAAGGELGPHGRGADDHGAGVAAGGAHRRGGAGRLRQVLAGALLAAHGLDQPADGVLRGHVALTNRGVERRDVGVAQLTGQA